jgi:sec-independent protein translocase protein TatA
MLSNLTGWHFIVILFVVLLLFGAPKLPALARSLGQSAKILKTELRPGDDDATPPAASAAPVESAAPASAAPASPSSPAVPTPGTPPA